MVRIAGAVTHPHRWPIAMRVGEQALCATKSRFLLLHAPSLLEAEASHTARSRNRSRIRKRGPAAHIRAVGRASPGRAPDLR